jgi:hypothetical protein
MDFFKGFFFEKKKQKTFIHLGLCEHGQNGGEANQYCFALLTGQFSRSQTDKSLFASFPSEKKDPSFP